MSGPELARRVRAGDRRALAQAITLAESTLPAQRGQAEALLAELLPATGGAHRVAVTGPPGAGKSTLVDALGALALESGRGVAVLAIDPASAISGGSLLGDAVRMQRLASSERAFVRASSSSGTLGGTAPATREAILLCEAAGFDLVLIETVGVGQAEQAARELCDTLLLLTLAGAGDEIQGLKRGLLEVADAVLVNKADAQNAGPAQDHAAQLQNALQVLRPQAPPHVAALSAATGQGVAELRDWLERRAHELLRTGALRPLREAQLRRAFRAALGAELTRRLDAAPGLSAELQLLADVVAAGQKLPRTAASELVARFLGRARG
ncbi:MAG TPA: methylmalonyl Co-A mutase-associated GTPase MeaB [Polyangiaceae bacterium]|nr:methylmalonyl Co-A mutase-associated GTPase MeaB [Polyangiaceae bacterium]